MQNILVVEDDHDLNQAICYSLKKSGYGTYGAESAESGRTEFLRNRIDLVLLDVNLPDGEGFSFCRWIKSRKETPVIYLTARDMEEDVLTGYESGAEDYITKPFNMKEVILRIHNVLKRVYKDTEMIDIDGYMVDESKRKVLENDHEIDLTTKEYELLLYFMKNKGIAISREQVLTRVWDENYFGSDRVVDDTLRRLRKKMPNINIKTIYGFGYRLD